MLSSFLLFIFKIMANRVVKKVYEVRNNWYAAFCQGIALKGYEYYKIPENIKYRYPAPGSVPHDEVSYPHLFKKHWKTPFRDSHFNIRAKEHQLTLEENTRTYITGFPDMTGTHLEGAQKPSLEGLTLNDDLPLDHPDKLAALRADFAAAPEQMNSINKNYSNYHGDLDAEYNMVQV
jgi:hypothetical protein